MGRMQMAPPVLGDERADVDRRKGVECGIVGKAGNDDVGGMGVEVTAHRSVADDDHVGPASLQHQDHLLETHDHILCERRGVEVGGGGGVEGV